MYIYSEKSITSDEESHGSDNEEYAADHVNVSDEHEDMIGAEPPREFDYFYLIYLK